MTKDLNKGISNISYNLLNLPQQVDILSPLAEARNAYSYSADGVKLRVVKKYNSTYNTSPVIGSAVNTSNLNVTKTTDYVGNKLFESNALDRILVDGGYIKGGVYYFYETDHLGDNRTVINQSGTVVERNDYYPYGMQMAHNQLTNSASGSDNKRKFGGKELDVMGGLNLYDSQARWYDPCIPILPTVDPLAEKYYSWSPYVYCGDNPLINIDPSGMNWYKSEDGNVVVWQEGNDKTITRTYGEGDNKTSIELSDMGESYPQYLNDGTLVVWNQNKPDVQEPQSFSQGKEMSTMEKWSHSDNFVAKVSYSFANDLYVTLHRFTLGLIGEDRTNELTGGGAMENLDGTTNYDGITNFSNQIPRIFSAGASSYSLPQGLGYINKLNAPQFSHLFKGTLSTLSPSVRGFLNKQIVNKSIDYLNGPISNGFVLLKAKSLAPNNKEK